MKKRYNVMKKLEQLKINSKVMQALTDYACEEEQLIEEEGKKLRSCSAKVYSVGSYYVLRSYNTVIAIIDKRTDTLYDFLRMVYGYTSTSAQHIAKFEHDYCQGHWGCSHRYTWRAV